jgi:hypothetical protein
VNEQELSALVAHVTPQRVRELVLQIESRQPASNRGTAPVYELLDAFSSGLAISAAAEQSPVDMALRRAIIAAVSQIEGMTFVEGDG